MKIDFTPTLQRDADTAALIAGTSQLASSAINAASVSGSSKKDREYMDKTYAKQRADALSDWERNNAYNSPASIMERYKAAGLNPNLIYGNNGQSPVPIRGSSFTPYHREAPKIDLGGAAAAFYGTKIQTAQLNNLEAQNQVLLAQSKNIDADTQLKTANTEKSQADRIKILAQTTGQEFTNNLNSATRDIQIAIKNQSLEKLKADTSFTLDQNQRAAITTAQNVQIGVSKLLSMDAERANTIAEKQAIYAKIKMVEASTELKNLDIEYINKTGNTGRPGESPLAKLVELIYGKLTQTATKTGSDTQNLPKHSPSGYVFPDKF